MLRRDADRRVGTLQAPFGTRRGDPGGNFGRCGQNQKSRPRATNLLRCWETQSSLIWGKSGSFAASRPPFLRIFTGVPPFATTSRGAKLPCNRPLYKLRKKRHKNPPAGPRWNRSQGWKTREFSEHPSAWVTPESQVITGEFLAAPRPSKRCPWV